MIRMSRLADYAVVLMTHMAGDPSPVHTAISVAGATGLPVPTVAKVLARLARGGLLESHRGAHGGYVLARAAGAISVAEIVAAVDGPIALTECSKAGPSGCEIEATCPSQSGLRRINHALQSALAAMSLAEVARAPMR